MVPSHACQKMDTEEWDGLSSEALHIISEQFEALFSDLHLAKPPKKVSTPTPKKKGHYNSRGEGGEGEGEKEKQVLWRTGSECLG